MQIPSRIRPALYAVAHIPPVRRVAERVPVVRRIYGGRRHPFDVENGTDTSGFVSVDDLAPDAAAAAQMNPYAGSQPSIVRRSLALLPDPHEHAFVDLGCGKGRPLVIASEFPFRRLVGVEIAPNLAAVAQANAAVVRSRHPRPRPARAALTPTSALDRAAGLLRRMFLIYYDPVWGDLLDASPAFSRWSAETLRYAPEEIGYGPDLKDAVVIWQSVPNKYPARPGAARSIVVTKPLWYAELRD